MKTEKCEEMMNRFLSGQVSEEMEQHFRECPECRGLASLDRRLAETHDRLPVPPEQDRAVLAYAAAKKRPAQKTWNIAFILHHAAIPIAAAAMVCIGLVFAFHQPDRNAARNSLAQSGKTSFSYDLDTVDSEILLLSSQIQDASARLSRTEAYTGINE